MKGFYEFSMPMHIISLVLIFVFFGILFIINIKHPKKINRYWDYAVGLFVLAAYSFVFLETITNSSIENLLTQSLLPWHNFTGLIVIVGSLSIMLPRKLKIRNYALALTLLMSMGLIYGMFDTTINYIRVINNNYLEREFWLFFYQFILIIYCFNSLQIGELKISWKEMLFTIITMFIIYGVSLVINLNLNLSLFGVGKYFYNLIQYPNSIYCLVDFGSIIIFVLLSYLVFVFPIKKLKKQ